MNTQCAICLKHHDPQNLPLLQSEYWRVEPGSFESGVKGYIYLEPLRHVEHWSEFTQHELIEMATLIPRIERAVRRLLPLERMYVVVISEAVRHLHLHLIPRQHQDQEKGLALIARATRHRSEMEELDRMEFNEFYNKLHIMLKSES